MIFLFLKYYKEIDNDRMQRSILNVGGYSDQGRELLSYPLL